MPGSNVPLHGYLQQTAHEVTTNAIFYADGTIESLSEPVLPVSHDAVSSRSLALARYEIPTATSRPSQAKPVPEHLRTLFQFAWWHSPQAYHASVRLASGRPGMLVDIGAVTNMCGDKWAMAVENAGKINGQGATWSSINPISLEGVGSGSSQAGKHAVLPICTADGVQGQFSSIVVQNSDLPALLGLQSIESREGVIDTKNHRMIYPGPGGIHYTLSPGSVVFKLEKSLSGHLLLPCCEWQKSQAGQGVAHSF